MNGITLPETNMETQKGPIKATVLLKGDYMGFHVSLGECKVEELEVPQHADTLETLGHIAFEKQDNSEGP